ncbi:transglutaminase family protein [Rhizobacter sp. AJA081-3]|uniref:transglutaminase-like domain-containing protein n=1 Tax=Rhizobacter sp. AJA081-3 TaxID=2753607 RepID=UPI001AE02D04|nr:transglutaminase family protein [Rhizobacter sp. AJA081-3]QTN21731.1 transglutaminase family protein [Rhizobacter sp. AJA081-3]
METLPPDAAALAPTPLIDSDHPAVIAFARQHAVGADERERAVALTLAVRDGFRYDPYRIDLSPQGMRASSVIAQGYGWCVPKAALLAAAARAAGIPARVGYADVRNHLSTERLRRTLQTDVFVWHGYTDLWIDGRWVKATPAFNIELCERFGLLPLDFDGRADSIYHPFDQAGNRHMEYVNQHGAFDDMPLARIVAAFAATYPALQGETQRMQAADFEADVKREVQR